MIEESIQIDCTGAELYYLGALLGGETLIGIQDPFVGWLTEEIVEAMPLAQQALAERDYLVVQPDGQIMLDERVAAIASALIMPDSVLLCNRTSAEGVVKQRTFYFQQETVVEAILLDAEQYRLVAHEDTANVQEQLVAWWGLDAQVAAPTPTLVLPESVLLAVGELARSEGVAAATSGLIEAGVEQAAAEAFASTLAHPHWNAAAVAVRRTREDWQTQGVAALDGEFGMWQLRAFERNGTPWVDITPRSAPELSEALAQLLTRFAA